MTTGEGSRNYTRLIRSGMDLYEEGYNIRELMETSISPYPKQLYTKVNILQYDKGTKKFEYLDDITVEQRDLTSGIELSSGIINMNAEQDISSTIDLRLTNQHGHNNWGSDFDPQVAKDFKWWLDKRIEVFIGLRHDFKDVINFVQVGHFVVTHFTTSHDVNNFPVIEMMGSSKEVMLASRRGKFLYPTTIRANTVMTEAIKRILLSAGEIEDNIYIDPSISQRTIKIEYGETDEGWRSLHPDVEISVDEEFAPHGSGSLRIDVNSEIPLYRTRIAEKEFTIPFDMSSINALAVWLRSSATMPDGSMSFIFINEDGGEVEIPTRELIGHIAENGEIKFIDNWRNMILKTEGIEDVGNLKKMQIQINMNQMDFPFTFWIDELYGAYIKNLLPYDLTYGAGQSRWLAVKELADLLDADAYYDEFGRFNLKKRKIPRDRIESEDYTFGFDVYEPLVPKITYTDTYQEGNLYMGAQSRFEEHELANHVQVLGGSTASTSTTLVDMSLRDDGFHIREKGKTLNSRGKVRAVDQFGEGAEPTIFNKDTDIREVYKDHPHLEQIVEANPDGFEHFEKPPYTNYTVEAIGDFIYHHNHANPDPLIKYTFEAKNRGIWEMRRRLGYAEQIDVISKPFYMLRLHDIIQLKDSLLKINDKYLVSSIAMPLNGEQMSINAVAMRELIVDIPYFDSKYVESRGCFYGYDAYAVTHPYKL